MRTPMWRNTHGWCRSKRSSRTDWNLNISRYVDTSDEEERIDVGEAVRKLRELEQERAVAEATMNRYLEELGYGA